MVIQKQRSLGHDLSAAAQAAVKVRRGDISHAVVVRTRKEYRRADGSYIRFDDNACVLVSKTGDPLGTRLSGKNFTSTKNLRYVFTTDMCEFLFQALLGASSGKRSGPRSCLWLLLMYKVVFGSRLRSNLTVETKGCG